MKFNSIQSTILDPNYGEQGISYPHSQLISINFSMIPPKDDNGRLCVGQARLGNGWGYALMRIDHTGNLDTRFGVGGLAIGTFKQGFNSSAGGIHLDGNNIIITGSFLDTSTNLSVPALARFDAHGQLDKSFGDQGHRIIEPPSPPQNWTRHAPTGPMISSTSTTDGIFVTYQHPWSLSVLMKFNIKGEFDTGFNTVGYKFLQPPNCTESSGRLALIDGRKIYICGRTTIKGITGPYILCLKDTGPEDNEFGENGYLLAENKELYFHDLDKLNDEGSIVCFASKGTTEGCITAFTRKGDKQPIFERFTEFKGAGGQWTHGHVDHSRRKIIATGTTLGGDEADVVVGRFKLDGSPDNDFGENNGWVRIALGGSIDLALNSSAEADGKTIICGTDFEQSKPRLGFLLRCKTDV